MLLLRGEDDERVATWVQKKTDKYTSPDIKKEMALKVLHTIVSNIQVAPFFSIMVDETTNTAIHTLNLAVSDTVRQCTVIGKAFDIVYEMST